MHHSAPWWFRILNWLAPGRCREIPNAKDPTTILIRQFAIIKRYCYLQQFASGEDPIWYHSHPWRRVFALGLTGSYIEERPMGNRMVQMKFRSAPYFFTMRWSEFHHVQMPEPGHTSIFLGWRRDDDLKYYLSGQTGEVVHWEKFIPENNRVERI